MSTLLNALAVLFTALPLHLALRTGELMGLVWFHVIRIRRKTVLENLHLALPDRTADHMQIAKAAYRHFGLTAVEFLIMSRLCPPQIAQTTVVDGMENFQAALSRNRGVIIVTAHLGNFDLLAASQAANGIPLAVVSRSLHQGGANRFWMESRKKSGLVIFEDRGAAKRILQHLKQSKVVALTVDQRTKPADGGIPLPFLGRPAMTPTAPAKLSAAASAPILPVYIRRVGPMRHRATVGPVLEPPPPKDEAAVRRTTETLNEIVSAWIREIPEQYMWLHRRFVIKNDDTGLSRMQSQAKLQR